MRVEDLTVTSCSVVFESPLLAEVISDESDREPEYLHFVVLPSLL